MAPPPKIAATVIIMVSLQEMLVRILMSPLMKWDIPPCERFWERMPPAIFHENQYPRCACCPPECDKMEVQRRCCGIVNSKVCHHIRNDSYINGRKSSVAGFVRDVGKPWQYAFWTDIIEEDRRIGICNPEYPYHIYGY